MSNTFNTFGLRYLAGKDVPKSKPPPVDVQGLKGELEELNRLNPPKDKLKVKRVKVPRPQDPEPDPPVEEPTPVEAEPEPTAPVPVEQTTPEPTPKPPPPVVPIQPTPPPPPPPIVSPVILPPIVESIPDQPVVQPEPTRVQTPTPLPTIVHYSRPVSVVRPGREISTQVEFYRPPSTPLPPRAPPTPLPLPPPTPEYHHYEPMPNYYVPPPIPYQPSIISVAAEKADDPLKRWILNGRDDDIHKINHVVILPPREDLDVYHPEAPVPPDETKRFQLSADTGDHMSDLQWRQWVFNGTKDYNRSPDVLKFPSITKY